MTKHTPGPWNVKAENSGYRIITSDHFKCLVGWISPASCSIVGRGTRCIKDDELKANARLIAAAPELFEELKALLEFARQYGPSPSTPYEDWRGFFESAEKVLNKV